VEAQQRKKRYRAESHPGRRDINSDTHRSNKKVATDANNSRISRDISNQNQVEGPKRGVKRRSLNEMLKEQSKKKKTEEYPPRELAEAANAGKRKGQSLESQAQEDCLRLRIVTAEGRPPKKRKTIEELMNVRLLTRMTSQK
jgi:hypothetical protein